MWLPETLTLRNFISHKDSKFEFKAGKAVMIQGINADDDCQESNGSGKSAIIEGTIFGLTGDSFRKVRAVDLIMNDEPSAEVVITMKNSISNKSIVIERMLDKKKASTVNIFVNGAPHVLSSVNEYNKFILEEIDISKDDLMNYFVVSKEKYQSFLLTGDTKKKEIIARFSNSNLIEGVDKLVEADAQTFTDKIYKLENTKSRLEGQIETLQSQIDNQTTQTDFETDRQEKVDALNEQISAIDKKISENDLSIRQHKKMLTEAEEKLSKFSVEDLKAKLKKAEAKETEITKLGTELKATAGEYETLIAEMNKNLAGTAVCPKCEHEFVVTDPEFDVAEGKELVGTLTAELIVTKSEISKKREDYVTAGEKRKEVESEIRKIEGLMHTVKLEVNKINSEISNCTRTKISYLSQVKSLEDSKESIKNMKFESNVKTLKENIKTANSEIKTIQESITRLSQEKQYLIEWVYVFKKFKTHLTNKSIKSIESFTNLFLTKIKTNLAVKMDGYKLLSDGKTVRENITVDILRNGLVEGPIEKFSGGEKVRVDICNILALQKLINLNSKSGGLDLLLLDEIVESVDSVGVSEILRQLNSINQTIAIITHANTIRDYDNVVVVTKQNGYSTVR